MFRKFEKTARIVVPQINVRGKLFLSDKETKLLLGGSVTVLEKIDGANVGIIRHKDMFKLQKRGSLVDTSEHAQFSFFKAWSMQNYNKLMTLPKDHVIYAELMRCTHTIYYDKLPDWVCVYGVWSNKRQVYLTWKEVLEICVKAELSTVPFISEDYFNKVDLYDLIPEVSAFGSEKAEGIVVWNYRHQLRGKIVRPEFSKQMDEDDHWSRGAIELNSIREDKICTKEKE
jgi:hypothetical protein